MMENNPTIGRRMILFFCLLFPFLSQSQPCLKASFDLDLKISSLEKDLTYCEWEGTVYYITNESIDIQSKRISLYSVNLKTGFTETFLLEMPKSLKIERLPFSFALNDQYLILNDDTEGKIFLYRKTGRSFHFENEVTIGPHLRFRSVTAMKNGKFLLFEVYDTSDTLAPKVTLAVFNPYQNKTESVIHPVLHCMPFSYFEIYPVAVNKDCIALADLCSYEIRIFDYDLKERKTIRLSESDYEQIKNAIIPFETNPRKMHPKTTIFNLLELDKKIQRIERIYFENDSLLWVLSTNRNQQYNKRLDVWNLNHTDQPYNKNVTLNIEFQPEIPINPGCTPVLLNRFKEPLLKNGKIITVNSDPFLPDSPTDYAHYLKMKDEYYEKHDPTFHLQIHTVTWDDHLRSDIRPNAE